MPRQATKAIGNMYYEARMKAAKYNEKLLTRAGAVELLPGVTEECLKKYELDINKPPNVVVALMADAYNAPELRQA
ncbi:MAG: XRE family transcriptional regulator, partial [Oscillospiraceae bacterium]|nr:XRE family transcriptional regulator [Oscillospiraceae bacterium]